MTDYKLDPVFERIVAQMLSTNATFYRKVGKHISPEIIQEPAAKTVVEMCKIMAEMDGKPPSSSVVVRQRLRSIYDSGKLDAETLSDALALLDDADEDADAYSVDDIVKELTPVLKRHAQKDALDTAIDAFSKRQDLSEVGDLLSSAFRIGITDSSLGSQLSSKVMDQISELRNAKKLPTGILELDAAISGGLDRGSLALFVGPTGSGKSMSLSHVAADAVSNGISVAYATLELGEEYVHARIISNLTDLCWEDIVANDRTMESAKTRLEILENDGLLGFCTVRYFTPNATSIADIDQWIKEEEETYGKTIDLVCIDYAALLSAPTKKAKYEELTEIAENMRSLAADRKCWLWSAAQVKASAHDRRNKKITSDQAAGSMGLSRTADLVITLNPRDEGETLMFRVDKNRYGRGGEDIGPLPHDFARGRVSPVVRDGWPF